MPNRYSKLATGKATREEVVAKAREFLEVPFKHQGRSTTGCDCAGLLWLITDALGLETWDIEKHFGYSRFPDGHTVNEIMSTVMDKLPPSDENLVPGNVVQLSFSANGREEVCHMGLLTDFQGGLGLIHSFMLARRVVEHRLDDEWLDRVKGVFRIRGTE